MPRCSEKKPKKFSPKISLLCKLLIVMFILLRINIQKITVNNQESMCILYEVIEKNHSMLNTTCSGSLKNEQCLIWATSIMQCTVYSYFLNKTNFKIQLVDLTVLPLALPLMIFPPDSVLIQCWILMVTKNNTAHDNRRVNVVKEVVKGGPKVVCEGIDLRRGRDVPFILLKAFGF